MPLDLRESGRRGRGAAVERPEEARDRGADENGTSKRATAERAHAGVLLGEVESSRVTSSRRALLSGLRGRRPLHAAE